MIIKLFKTDDDNNKVGKLLTDEIEFNIRLKGDTSIIEPMIILKSDLPILSNYAFIPNFNRYYFIENVVVSPNNIYQITLKVDVLESFKNDILLSSAYIGQQTNVNNYYNSSYESEVRKEVDKYYSNVILEEDTETILGTIGGM